MRRFDVIGLGCCCWDVLGVVEHYPALDEKSGLLELAQASGNFQFDHSKLQQTKDLAVEVEKRIRTLHKLVDGQPQVSDGIPVEADDRPVTEKFDEYFGEKTTGEALA